MKDPIIDLVVQKAGGPGRLAKALGIKSPSLYSWPRIPAERVLEVERITGVPRHQLRPDLYPIDRPAPEAA